MSPDPSSHRLRYLRHGRQGVNLPTCGLVGTKEERAFRKGRDRLRLILELLDFEG